MRKTFMKGIEFKDTNARSNALAKHFPQTIRANGFSLGKKQYPPNTFFCSTSFF
jgi:hypothetical protein